MTLTIDDLIDMDELFFQNNFGKYHNHDSFKNNKLSFLIYYYKYELYMMNSGNLSKFGFVDSNLEIDLSKTLKEQVPYLYEKFFSRPNKKNNHK